MTTYFKAVRPDGGSFHNPDFKWATEPGGVTTHPSVGVNVDVVNYGAAGYLSVSTVATDCTGMRWPCRLLEVEPVGDLWTPGAAGLPNKRAGLSFRTVRELPATEALGPQGVQVAALIERCAGLADDDARKLGAAWDVTWEYAAWVVAWDAALVVAWDAALDVALVAVRDAVRGPVWYAARDAAWALVARDLIGDTFTQAHYDTLTMPWRTVIGPIHPDDAVVGA